MQTAYVHVVVLLHAAFAAVFYFLDRESPSRFARLFAWSWVIEGVRAAILLPGVRALGGPAEGWFAVSDVLCYPANWCLLSGCAGLVGRRLPRWLGPAYFGTGVPLVLFGRYGLPGLWPAAGPEVAFAGIVGVLVVMFVPVVASRVAILVWLVRLWRESRQAGAGMAAVFCVPYALVAAAVPFQFYFSYTPDWIALLWCVRVLGFSIGLVMLMMSRQRIALAKSEANLAAAQALTSIGSWELDVASGAAIWSAEMYRLYGRDPAAGVMSYEELVAAIHPEDRGRFQEGEARALEARRDSEHEFRIRRPDGRVRWIHGRNVRFFGPRGEFVRIIGAEQDVTERKQAAARVELQHAVTRVLAEGGSLEAALGQILELIAREIGALGASCWTVERGGGKLRCTQLWSGGTVMPEAPVAGAMTLVGAEIAERIVAERRPLWLETAQLAGGNWGASGAGLRGGGGLPILMRAEAQGAMIFFVAEGPGPDAELMRLLGVLGSQVGQFVERHQLEDQYRQAQKMEAVGTLAGGIAHDFNNVLNAVTGFCELARLEIGSPAQARLHLEAAQAAAHRGAEVVRQIMTFSRQKELQRTALDLGAVVRDALKLLRATLPATIEIRTAVAENLPAVRADPTSLHQIVLNLGANARHAMKGGPGRLDVSVAEITVDAAAASGVAGLKPGRHVCLRVADTGCGMREEMLARIFEPFFTTKGPGEGTGLGLAVVHGIVQAHEGAIAVRSQPGAGTEFLIYLPVHAGPAATPEAQALLEVPRGRGERVLYVDDERPLCVMGKRMLERTGYRVEAEDNVLAAVEKLQAEPGRFDVVVTDLSMPAMSGLEFAARVQALRPGLPLVLTSGYMADLTPAQLREKGVTEFLMKPHSADLLGWAVHRALRAADDRSAAADQKNGGGPSR